MSDVKKHYMEIPWDDLGDGTEDLPAVRASLTEKAEFLGHIGLLQLSAGSGAWRVKDAMNTTARALGVTCSEDVGLTSINYTVMSDHETVSYSLSLKTTGINTDRLMSMSHLTKKINTLVKEHTLRELHELLEEIEKKPGNYTAFQQGLGSGFACSAFTFLLGGGPWEMLFALFGAFLGNFIRVKMLAKKFSLFFCVAVSVAIACVTYIVAITAVGHFVFIADAHQAGYICAMLFIIPGFPLITGGIDIAKIDMRSGLEREAYALMIITIATVTGAIVASLLNFHPMEFVELGLSPAALLILRLITSFVGVYGFSIMYNSPRKMCATAGCIGMIANTLRLTLAGLGLAGGVAAFIGAFTAGILAAVVRKRVGYPRLSLTVPSIVIMVPGMYMYRGIFYIESGAATFSDGATWIVNAFLIVLGLPLGLVFARFLTDKNFRYCT